MLDYFLRHPVFTAADPRRAYATVKAMREYREEIGCCEFEGCRSSKRTKPQVHHIERIEGAPERAADKANFICLCSPHHFAVGHGCSYHQSVANVRELCDLAAIVDLRWLAKRDNTWLQQTLESCIEIKWSERNKTWKVKETFTINTQFGPVTITAGYEHDRYTFAPNLKNEIPAIVHDFLTDDEHGHQLDDGTVLTRKQADQVLLELMRAAGEKKTVCDLYYIGVRFWAIVTFTKHKGAE